MHHANVFLTNLAIVLCVAAVTTVVFQRLRQPVVLGYLIAGLLVGPHVPFPLVADSETIEGLSELGVILLLFGIGLEFTLKKLLRVGAAAAIVAAVEISVQIILGDLSAQMFGWRWATACRGSCRCSSARILTSSSSRSPMALMSGKKTSSV